MNKENAAHIALIERQNKHRNETISDDKTRKHINPLSLDNILDKCGKIENLRLGSVGSGFSSCCLYQISEKCENFKTFQDSKDQTENCLTVALGRHDCQLRTYNTGNVKFA